MSAISNARWLTLSQFFRVLIQLIALFILARLLPPSDYGLMAMATVAINFASLLRDMGTAAAIIHREDLNEKTTNTIFWLNVFLGCGLAVILVSISSLVALLYNTARLAPVLCFLALVFPISSSGAVHQALLERGSKFRTLARIEISSALGGLITAVVLAYLGFGVMSLVWQALVAAVLSALQLWIASKWKPRLIWSVSELKALWGYSGNLTGFTFINFFARNADSMIIGRMLGSVPLGIYSQAYKVMMFPLQNMTWVASRALFPVMSRQQDDRVKMSALYFRSLRLIVTVTAPLMAGLWVLREPFVRATLGNQWHDVVGILYWLAPVGFIQSVVSTTGTVFMATGRTDMLMKTGLITTGLQVTAFYIGVNWGIEGVAMWYLIANILGAFPLLYFAVRQLECKSADLISAVWKSIVFSLIMIMLLLPFYNLLLDASYSLPMLILLPVVVGVGIYGVLMFLFSKDLIIDIKRIIGMSS